MSYFKGLNLHFIKADLLSAKQFPLPHKMADTAHNCSGCLGDERRTPIF